MTTDILIPLGIGSTHDNLELRMCLRSIQKHLTGVGSVVIVGESPDWLQNVIHVSCRDMPGLPEKDRNIYRKIIEGCKSVSDNFLFMNDDHFLLTAYHTGEFPDYHSGDIDPSKHSDPSTKKQLLNTVNLLGADSLFYDVHCPVVYNKEKFIKTFEGLPWPSYGYAIKSVYCNSNLTYYKSVNPFQCEDLKFRDPMSKGDIYKQLEKRKWFSIGDGTLRSGDMKEVLEELYPDKSKYEI